MIKNLAETLADKIITSGTSFKAISRNNIVYGLECFFYEGSKIIGFFIIFAFMGYIKEYLFALAVMYLLRPFIGGYHSRNNNVCWVVSFLYFLSIIIGSQYFYINFYDVCLLLVCSNISVLIIAPVIENIDQRSKKEILSYKIKAIIFTLSLSFCVLIYNNIYTNIVLLSIIETVLFAFIGLFVNRHRRIYNK